VFALEGSLWRLLPNGFINLMMATELADLAKLRPYQAKLRPGRLAGIAQMLMVVDVL